MTENGRKRCRKTKLVPRDCADFVDDDLVLQGPQKKPLLEKIKRESEDYIPQDTSHQFSVKVEIEDMDGSVPDEDPSDYMKYLFSLSKEGQEDSKDLDYADNSLLLEQKLVIPLPEDEKNCIVDVKKLQRILAVLHKKYPQDEKAVMYTRNQWGKVFREKLPFDFKRTPQEILIQTTLERWKDWVAGRSRESPFSYKCYICNVGWWSLTEFTVHITNHPTCNFQIETRNQECNIVAYGTEGFLYKDIPIYGKCLKCAKTYDHHMTNKRGLESYYYCNYCDERFQTCRTLTKHEGTCPRNPIRVLAVSKAGKDFTLTDHSCVVCHTVFMSNVDLMEHMTICHKVRSDEPMVTKSKACSACLQVYNHFNFHTCLKKNVNYECKYCTVKFHTKQMLEHHMKMWDRIYQCKECGKFLQKSCMAAEHYALHSEHFRTVIRCVICKKIKVFLSEDAWKNHKTKYHRRVDYRRPTSEKVIMARIMLEECVVETPRKTGKIQKPVRSKPNAKLTRGEPIPSKAGTSVEDRKLVRVYVPVHKTTALEPPENATIAHDATDSMSTEEVKENVLVKVKQEKEESEKKVDKTVLEKINEKTEQALAAENLQKNEKFDNTEMENDKSHEKLAENFVETVIKTEKIDDDESSHLEDNPIENERGRKDITNIMAELNEFLDIKPEIIVKEEHMSEDESQLSSIMSSEISKVFHASSTFAEEITDNAEHSKVLELSKSILESEIKKEVKCEPMDDDPIKLDLSEDSAKQSGVNNEPVLNIEPEVILKAGYRKRKVYKCNKCDYSGFHREYKEHINNHCYAVPKKPDAVEIFFCTKCGKGFPSLKKYALHFEKHGYRYMSCPQCREGFDSVTKLVAHVNVHIKGQFVRVQLLQSAEDSTHCKVYQCKACKEIEKGDKWFEHWEKHLKLDNVPKAPLEKFKVGEKGQHALSQTSLQEVLAVLTTQERSTDRIYVKSCIVCNRVFERRNDTKRHLIEHLLEDAYAKIANSQLLKCQICDELHKKPDKYKKHMRDHANLPIYQCGLCNKSFSDSSNFTKHKKIHNSKAFTCDICSKRFQAKFSLEKHIQMHMETDPITCEPCSRVFHDRSFYKRHVRQHHEKGINRYRCMLCREKFPSLRDKWDHMWLVHRQRKEEADCPICGTSYRKFYDVKKHAYEVHGRDITLSNLWNLLSKIKARDGKMLLKEPTTIKETVPVLIGSKETKVDSSDDDCLLIEEERETLVVYD